MLVIRHVYIERRMIPLNIYLKDASPEQIERVVVEYGNAIKDLVAANIFPGDMLWKNFGMTRQDKVVFYDYDEIEYLTDCRFRRVPPIPEGWSPENRPAAAGTAWFEVGPKDVFPETFGPILLGNAVVRQTFLKHHGELLAADYWNQHKERILGGAMLDVFPYDPRRRFVNRRGAAQR
jgi:isocitrate dehydrogenase kinase/phosphatase